MRRAEDGLSLIELLVVMLLLSILAMMSVPSLNQWWANCRLTLLTTRLEQAIRFTRQSAMMTGVAHQLCSADRVGGQRQWSSDWLVLDANTQQVTYHFRGMMAPFSLTWRSSFGYNQCLSFAPDGVTSGQQGRFILSDASRKWQRAIVVSRSGRLRLES